MSTLNAKSLKPTLDLFRDGTGEDSENLAVAVSSGTVRPTPSPSIFISYSHKDKRWCERLVVHLSAFAAEGALEIWSDQKIGAGDDWHARIERAIDRAVVTILLVSADFLASPFIHEEEIPRLLKRRQQKELIVIPMICRPCAWRRVGWLASMLVRPNDARALSVRTFPQSDAELAALAEEVCDLLIRGR